MGGKKLNINDYQRMLSTYLERRRRMNEKIARLREAIKNRKIRKDNLDFYRNICIEYFGVDINKINRYSKKRTESERIAIRSFCRYGIENGIAGSDISRYLGYKNIGFAASERMKLLKQFKKDEQARQTYRKFAMFMNAEIRKIKRKKLGITEQKQIEAA